MRERDRGVERKADGVGELAIAGEPLAELRRPHRMDEDQAAELLREADRAGHHRLLEHAPVHRVERDHRGAAHVDRE